MSNHMDAPKEVLGPTASKSLADDSKSLADELSDDALDAVAGGAGIQASFAASASRTNLGPVTIGLGPTLGS